MYKESLCRRMKIFKFLPIILFAVFVLYFFKPFIFDNKLPIPSDTIIGLYHPFRDLYSSDYPNGVPFKNFLITDPVRQQFPWRELAVELEKRFELPLWNPYSFSGTPLLANMQSAVFYPLNILFFLLPYEAAWSMLIVLQPLFAGIFLYFYLNNLKLNKWSNLVGAIAFSFSGFGIAWMEWGTILHVGLWLPLMLLSIDKIFVHLTPQSSKLKAQNSKLQFKSKNLIVWSLVFVLSLTSSFFAGHPQTFFYLFVLTLLYWGVRFLQFGKQKSILLIFFILNSLFLILISIQWLPTIQFISESARSIDQPDWQKEGWFIPWQNLIQFIAPDFFGNPATLNYWGTWNYGEFIGYIGIFPLLMAIFALFFRHDKKTLFFGILFFISLLFSLPTIFAKLPFMLSIPFVSTAQPTRLLFVTDFSLAVLAAFGFDYFIRSKSKKIVYPLGFIVLIFLGLWAFVVFGNGITKAVSAENILVAKRNLILPTSIFAASAILLFIGIKFSKLHKKFTLAVGITITAITAFDLLRFGFKFTPFTNKEYLFPNTKIIAFIKNQQGEFRIMSADSRILPPNFSVIYRLQSVDGYDPLYLKRYGELIAASERGEPNINPPFGFNRIIAPHNYESKIMDLLGVKYVLSLSDLKSDKLKKVFQEGQTRVYENKNVLSRTFFTEDIVFTSSKEETIKVLFKENLDLKKTAVVEESLGGVAKSPPRWTTEGCSACEAKIVNYGENRIVVGASASKESFLVLTDSFYPTWHAKIDGKETKIFRTDYNFRGIIVPMGEHKIEFYNSLF